MVNNQVQNNSSILGGDWVKGSACIGTAGWWKCGGTDSDCPGKGAPGEFPWGRRAPLGDTDSLQPEVQGLQGGSPACWSLDRTETSKRLCWIKLRGEIHQHTFLKWGLKPPPLSWGHYHISGSPFPQLKSHQNALSPARDKAEDKFQVRTQLLAAVGWTPLKEKVAVISQLGLWVSWLHSGFNRKWLCFFFQEQGHSLLVVIVTKELFWSRKPWQSLGTFFLFVWWTCSQMKNP